MKKKYRAHSERVCKNGDNCCSTIIEHCYAEKTQNSKIHPEKEVRNHKKRLVKKLPWHSYSKKLVIAIAVTTLCISHYNIEFDELIEKLDGLLLASNRQKI